MNEKEEVGRILKECFRRGERKVSEEILEKQSGRVREVLEKYNLIVDEIELLSRQVFSKKEYEKRIGELKKVWGEIKDYLPLLDRDDIIELIRNGIGGGRVDFEKCIDVAIALSSMERPMRFSEIMEEVRDSGSFRDLRDTSIGRQLSRSLEYLIEYAKIAMKCERKTMKSVAGTRYFRFFNFGVKEDCTDCLVLRKLIEELERLLQKLKVLTESKN